MFGKRFNPLRRLAHTQDLESISLEARTLQLKFYALLLVGSQVCEGEQLQEFRSSYIQVHSLLNCWSRNLLDYAEHLDLLMFP